MTAELDLERAQLLLDVGRPEEARLQLARAVASDPENAAALALLARALIRTRRLDDALTAARRAAALAPESPEGHVSVALSLLMLNRHDQAVRAAREAVRLAPDEAYHHVVLSYALSDHATSARRRRDRRAAGVEARVAGLEAVRLAPGYAEAYGALGYVGLVTGAQRAAVADYREALRLDPSHAVARTNLGVLQVHTLRLFDAGHSFSAALRDDPSLDEARQSLAAVLARGLVVLNVLTFVAALLHGAALSADSRVVATAGRAAVGALLLAALVATVVALRRGPRAVRGYYLRMLRRRPAMLLLAALTAVGCLSALTAAVVPPDLASTLALGQLGLTVVLVPVLLWLVGLASWCLGVWRRIAGSNIAVAVRRCRRPA